MVDGKPVVRGTTIPEDDTRTTDLIPPAAPQPAVVVKALDEEGPTTPFDQKRLLEEAAAHGQSLEFVPPRAPLREVTSVTMRIEPPAALVRATMPPEDPRRDAAVKPDGRNAPTTPGERLVSSPVGSAPAVALTPANPRAPNRRAAGRKGDPKTRRRIPSLERMESKITSVVMIGTQLALFGALVGVTVVAFRSPAITSSGATPNVDERPAAGLAVPDNQPGPASPPVAPAPLPDSLAEHADEPMPPETSTTPEPVAPLQTPSTPPVAEARSSSTPWLRTSKDRPGRGTVHGSTVAAAAAMASSTLVAIAPARPAVAPPPPPPASPQPPPAAPPPPPAVTADTQMQRLTQEADQELNSNNKAHTKTGR